MNKSWNARISPRRVSAPAAETRPTTASRPFPDPEGLLTKREVARRLKKHLRSIDVYMRKRRLPYYKFGRSVLFSWPEIMACMRRREALPPEPSDPSSAAR